MAYRNPSFGSHHMLRLAGAAAIGGSAFNATKVRARAHDSASGKLAAFNGTTANQFVKVDRGAGYASLAQPTALIIPAGHNLTGAHVDVRGHTSDPPDGVTGTVLVSGYPIVAGVNYVPFAALTMRYASITVQESGTAWEFGELWATVFATPSIASPDPAWEDERIPRIVETTLESGVTFRQAKGATRRSWRVTYNAVGIYAPDLVLFRTLESDTQDGLYPFWYLDELVGNNPLLCELVGRVRYTQDAAIPVNQTTFRVEFEIREVLA